MSRCLRKMPSVKWAAAWSAHRDGAYAVQTQRHAKPLLLQDILPWRVDMLCSRP